MGWHTVKINPSLESKEYLAFLKVKILDEWKI